MTIILTPEYKNNLKALAKKYRKIRTDITPVINQLEQGQKPGNRLQRLEEEVYKVRIRNSDSRRGKSGGYRLLYYVYTEEAVTLLTIYSKSDRSDVNEKEVRDWLKNI